jgi:hypothetical protein
MAKGLCIKYYVLSNGCWVSFTIGVILTSLAL